MSGFTKEEILRRIANASGFPSEIVYYDSDVEFVAEKGKVYFIVGLFSWSKDLVIKFPPLENLSIGFSFDIFLATGLGGYNVQVTADDLVAWFGDEADPSALGLGLPFPLDMQGQHVRFTYIGLFPPALDSGVEVPSWLVTRLDNQVGATRLVSLATTEALPSYTAEGSYSTRKLIGDSGTLTVDGVTIDELGSRLSVLVKDEGGDSEYHGIYYPIQLDPWILRRRSDWCFTPQMGKAGTGILVTAGEVNEGKLFYSRVDPGDGIEDPKSFDAAFPRTIQPDYILSATHQTTNANTEQMGQVTLRDSGDRTISIRATIWALQSGGTGGTVGDAAKYVIEALATVASGSLILKDQYYVYTHEDQAGWNAFIQVNGLQVRMVVTGASTVTIEWRGLLEVNEHG